MSKTYKCCIVIYDDARVLHANKGDEQADTCSDGFIQRSWNSLQYQATHLGDSKNNEDDTFQQHGGEGKLPGVSHAKTYGIYKECVKTHARSQCERLLGIDRHYQRTDDGCQGCSRKHTTGRHAGQGAEDTRIDGQDIGHGKECGDARHDLCADIVLLRIEAEDFLNCCVHLFK